MPTDSWETNSVARQRLRVKNCLSHVAVTTTTVLLWLIVYREVNSIQNMTAGILIAAAPVEFIGVEI